MNSSLWWRGILMAVLVIGVATAIGIGSYNAGVAHGIAESGRAIVTPPAAGAPYPYGWHRPWGVGFFPIFPFFAVFFFFFVLRGLWGGGRWGGWGPGWGYGHRYRDGVPPAFDEWHRRAHGEPPPSKPAESR